MLEHLSDKIWAMEPTACEILHRRMAALTEFPSQERIEAFNQNAASKALRKSTGGIAIMRIHGLIEPRMSMMSMIFGGGFSIEDGSQALDELMSARDVSTIVMDFDSPGGLSDGVQEFADQIFAARESGKKPIHAIANTTAASAGFWLATQANSFSITPSGLTGSLGVYTSHISFQKQLEAEGVQVTTVTSTGAPFKAELSPYANLTAAGRDHLQMMVDETHDQFVSDVARGMRTTPASVRSGFGKGRVLSPAKAVEVGAVHRVISFRDLLAQLKNGGGSNGNKVAASVSLLRMRHEHAKRTLAVMPPGAESTDRID